MPLSCENHLQTTQPPYDDDIYRVRVLGCSDTTCQDFVKYYYHCTECKSYVKLLICPHSLPRPPFCVICFQ